MTTLRQGLLWMIALSACSGSDDPGTLIVGAWNATTFLVTPAGQPQTNVLSAGGSLNIVVAADHTTTGTLNVPASLNNGTPFTASMAGTASLTGSSVMFTQTADTFVRNLTFTLSGNTLTATSQTAGNGTFTIVLTRQ